MLRRAFIPALALACGACVMDPSQPYLGGVGDPVRGAAINAPWIFGDMSRWRGNPSQAAFAAAQLEFLTDALLTDPMWAPQMPGTLQAQMRAARSDLRTSLGIAPDAPPAQVIRSLRAAGDALAQGRGTGAAVNIAGGSRASVNEVLAEIARLAGTELRIRRLPPQPGDVQDTWADTTAARALLGFAPRVGLAEGLAAEWADLRQRTAGR